MPHGAFRSSPRADDGDLGLNPRIAAPPGLEENGHRPSRYRERRIGTGRTPFTHLWAQRIGTERDRVLPDNQSDIIVGSDGRAWIAGPATGVELPRLEPGTTVHGLRIATAWLRSVSGVDAAELTDRRTALNDLFPTRITRRLIDALWADRIDRELAELLWPEATTDARVAHAVAALTSRTAPAVAALAETMGISDRHLRRLVEHHTGLTPKTIQQVARLQRAIAVTGRSDRVGIAQIAAVSGYSDQAHLTREARRFSGLTPSLLFARPSLSLMAEQGEEGPHGRLGVCDRE